MAKAQKKAQKRLKARREGYEFFLKRARGDTKGYKRPGSLNRHK